MPDVEVSTYLHQSWPALVDDIDRQPPGTRTVVIGYSLGANSSVFVANKAKYVDLIIALQPSMLSWNPRVTGKVGRMIEVYNPNPWMTFGGMGSKKLVGGNIEYIANNDSHPGAQFSSEFRHLVIGEIARLSAKHDLVTAQAEFPNPPKTPGVEPVSDEVPAKYQTAGSAAVFGARSSNARGTAQAEIPGPPKGPRADPVREELPPNLQPTDSAAFLDALSNSVDSGDLSLDRRLTAADMKDYAKRIYRVSPAADDSVAKGRRRVSGDVVAANSADPDRNVLYSRQ